MRKEPFKYSVVILTGGSSGIGASFLASILKLDQNVVICNISRQKPEIKDERIYHFPCDLSKSESVEEVFVKISNMLKEKPSSGKVLLINNSGFGQYGEFQESELSKQLNMIDLNVEALVHLTRLFLPLILERGGAVINVASTLGFLPTPYMATYGATKSFVLDWSLALGEELRKQGVQVLALCPGATKTKFFSAAGAEKIASHRQSAEEVVDSAWKALETGKSFVISGWKNKLLVGILKFLPLSWVTRIAGKAFKERK